MQLPVEVLSQRWTDRPLLTQPDAVAQLRFTLIPIPVVGVVQADGAVAFASVTQRGLEVKHA